MFSTEKWSKTVTVEKVIQMSQSDEASKIELDKKSSSSQDFCRATARTVRTVVNRFTTQDGESSEETLPRTKHREKAQTEIRIKFKVYVT